MMPSELPSTSPRLWPRPERGAITAAIDGSAMCIAKPAGISTAAVPGAIDSVASMQASRSTAAAIGD